MCSYGTASSTTIRARTARERGWRACQSQHPNHVRRHRRPSIGFSPVALDERGMLTEAGFDPDTHVIDGAVATTVQRARLHVPLQSSPNRPRPPGAPRRPSHAAAAPRTRCSRSMASARSSSTQTRSGGRRPPGGHSETIERSARIRSHIVQRLRRKAPAEIALVDSETASSPSTTLRLRSFTNDLSLPQQIDAYGDRRVPVGGPALARIAPVTVTVVPSNHSAWREASKPWSARG